MCSAKCFTYSFCDFNISINCHVKIHVINFIKPPKKLFTLIFITVTVNMFDYSFKSADTNGLKFHVLFVSLEPILFVINICHIRLKSVNLKMLQIITFFNCEMFS